jgi:translation initiation factor eIF-2B subunit delta
MADNPSTAPTVKVVGFEVSNEGDEDGVDADQADGNNTTQVATTQENKDAAEKTQREIKEEGGGGGALAAPEEAVVVKGGDELLAISKQSEQTQSASLSEGGRQVSLDEDTGPAPSNLSEMTQEKNIIQMVTQPAATLKAKGEGFSEEKTTAFEKGKEEGGEEVTQQQQQQQQPSTTRSGANEVSSAVDEDAQEATAATMEDNEDQVNEQLRTKLSLRSPVMILPLTDTMTLSPMHGQQRSTLDDILTKKQQEEKDASAAASASDGNDPNATKTTTEENLVASPTVVSPPKTKESLQEEQQAQAQAQEQPPAKRETPLPQPTPVSPKKTTETETSQQQQQQQPKKKEKKEPPKNIEYKKKPKLTKAERRELQEKQRAAKAALKAEQGQGGGGGGGGGSSSKKASQSQSQNSSSINRPPSGPYGEFDNEKHNLRRKRKSLVPRETRKSRTVELFSHLPQFDNKSLEKSFQSLLSSGLHPEVVKLGQAYANLSISGANARCLAMLTIFKLVIQDYNTPPGKSLTRDLTNHINVIIQFLIDCRPLAVTMGNAIRYFKTEVGSIHPSTPDMEAKTFLIETIDQFIQDKILDASKAVAETASSKIQEGDVILTYALSSSVLKTLEAAHRRGCKFRVIVVDSRPHFEGSKLLSKLCKMGVSCTYAYITSLSYILPQVTTVFIGAAAALANGTVVSRVGTAAVAVMAREFNIPVVVCCETYKFSHRVQLDALTHNELGDPDALVNVKDRPEVKLLQKWDDLPNLRLLNLRYDALAEKYITMIATEVGMIPASSVPVILREYNVCGPAL